MATAADKLVFDAGPPWLSVPLTLALLVSMVRVMRAREGPADPTSAVALSVAGFLLLFGALVARHLDRDPAIAELLLYGCAQTWILSFWALRGNTGPDDSGEGDGGEPRGSGGDGDGPAPDDAPSWWPDFEREFRDYERRPVAGDREHVAL